MLTDSCRSVCWNAVLRTTNQSWNVRAELFREFLKLLNTDRLDGFQDTKFFFSNFLLRMRANNDVNRHDAD